MSINSSDQIFEQLIHQNVPLASYTTLGVGGPARFFAEVTTSEAVAAGVEWARSRSQPLFVLAGGSNVVIADAGFPGLVLKVAIGGMQTSVEGDDVLITVGAGEVWDGLVASCVSENWAGFECLSGIPGSVGATPIQNVGAYGQEIAESFVSLEAFDIESGTFTRIGHPDCEFGYRASRFRTRDRGRFIITSVVYRLKRGNPTIRYAELRRYFADRGIDEPTLAEVRQAVLAIRSAKAMVIDPNEPDSRSVGSFFMNPVVTTAKFEEILERARASLGEDIEMPSFGAPADHVKLSAAWLIERAGFERGYTYGNVGVSSKHSLAIVNRGGGSALEVVELADRIKARVLDVFGVELLPEPILVGFAS